VELHDVGLGFEPWAAAGGIATRRPLAVSEADDGRTVMEMLDPAVGECLDRGKTVVTLAGEHTGVVGAIRAHARRVKDLSVVQLDAHSDMRRTYLDDPWNHACTMARVLDFHRDVVQVGIRSESPEDAELVQEHRIPVFHGERIQRDAARRVDWIDPIIEACSANVYVTLDCDVLDPSVMPATGTPEPGGLTWGQLNELLERLCRTRVVVGFDLSELAPVAGLSFPELTAAKLVYRVIGWMGATHEP
jgi:agmatinase